MDDEDTEQNTEKKRKKKNITVNSTSHLPDIPFLLLNMLNKEFATTGYCVIL